MSQSNENGPSFSFCRQFLVYPKDKPPDIDDIYFGFYLRLTLDIFMTDAGIPPACRHRVLRTASINMSADGLSMATRQTLYG